MSAASAELCAATDGALVVPRRLGARIDEARLRPVNAYYDVWSLLEAPQTFSIQRAALTQLALLCAAAPHVLEMIARVIRMVEGEVEPAQVFPAPRAQ